VAILKEPFKYHMIKNGEEGKLKIPYKNCKLINVHNLINSKLKIELF